MLSTVIQASPCVIRIEESSPLGIKTNVNNIDYLLERPYANYTVLVDVHILATAAHRLIAGEGHSIQRLRRAIVSLEACFPLFYQH